MQNPVALITGSARRIGAEISRYLHSMGMNVVLHHHHSEVEAQQLARELNQTRPESATAIKADLLDISAIQQLVAEAAAQWNRLDILVNNASRFYKTDIERVTSTEWDDLLNSNLKAPFFLSQAAAPYLKKQEGAIVNIVDIHAERPVRDYPVYCISKAGLAMLTKALAKELGPEIRVNAVAPGAIVWPENQNALPDVLKQKIISSTALQRHGHPSDIAKAVSYLVREGSYITGQVITVDGGRNLVT